MTELFKGTRTRSRSSPGIFRRGIMLSLVYGETRVATVLILSVRALRLIHVACSPSSAPVLSFTAKPSYVAAG
jgi:hypothetical protein